MGEVSKVGTSTVMDLNFREKLGYSGGNLNPSVNNGIAKKVSDLETSVGTTSSTGLRKKVSDLETSVGTNDASGLRKKVQDLITKVDSNGTTDVDTLRNLIDTLIFCIWSFDKNYGDLNGVMYDSNETMRHFLKRNYLESVHNPSETPWPNE